jgi:hypothetical protein
VGEVGRQHGQGNEPRVVQGARLDSWWQLFVRVWRVACGGRRAADSDGWTALLLAIGNAQGEAPARRQLES